MWSTVAKLANRIQEMLCKNECSPRKFLHTVGTIVVCVKMAEDIVYDAIIVGSGVKECLLGSMLSCITEDSTVSPDGGIRKVLHIGGYPQVTPDVYGNADNASWTLAQLLSDHNMHKEHAVAVTADTWKHNYCFDASPVLLTRSGALARIMKALGIMQYAPFAEIETEYMCTEGFKVVRVPVHGEVSALSLLEKAKFKKFASWVMGYNQQLQSSHNGTNASQLTARAVFKKFKLDVTTQLMIGHCMAGYATDAYLDEVFLPTLIRVQEYLRSAAELKEPSTLISPILGSKGLIEGIVRKALGTGVQFLLREEFEDLVFSDTGAVLGIRCISGNVYRARNVICTPEVMSKTNRVSLQGYLSKGFGRLKTDSLGTTSAHILFPGKIVNSRSDLHVTILGPSHSCAPTGFASVCMATFGENNVLQDLRPATDFFSSLFEKDS
jgi:RAB protein geranylgeranyltransferase component A